MRIDEIWKFLRDQIPTIGVCQVGSSLVSNGSKTKDIDFLLVSELGTCETYQNVFDALEDFGAEKIKYIDDSVRFNYQGTTINIAVYEEGFLIGLLDEIIEGKNILGEQRVWANLYWLPEAFCWDIANCRIIYDPHEIISAYQRTLISYPEEMAHAMITHCIDEIRGKVRAIKALTSDDLLESHIVKTCLSASLIRLAFVLDRTFLRGFYRMKKQTCTLSNSQSRELIRIAEVITMSNDRFDDKVSKDINKNLNKIKYEK